MSDREERALPPVETEDPRSSGPNLVLIYGLVLLGFVVAFIVAALIVLPFYHRR